LLGNVEETTTLGQLSLSFSEQQEKCFVSEEKTKPQCSLGFKFSSLNSPHFVRCDWFLRYFEGFALNENSGNEKLVDLGFSLKFSVNNVCNRGSTPYIDWEEMFQDARVEWSNSNWVLASAKEVDLWRHVEIDDANY
jgi:hypothetical protein